MFSSNRKRVHSGVRSFPLVGAALAASLAAGTVAGMGTPGDAVFKPAPVGEAGKPVSIVDDRGHVGTLRVIEPEVARKAERGEPDPGHVGPLPNRRAPVRVN